MTEEEKSKLRQLKADVADGLQRQRHFYEKKYRYALADTDGRIGGYVFSVIDNPEAHNLYELLKVRRFFSMLDRWRWNARRVKKFVKFYEMSRRRTLAECRSP